jgi:amidase/aspartyl-tRNA(Asn)/glutamyl-tRNA(Gln) amidotransferase subunit A
MTLNDWQREGHDSPDAVLQAFRRRGMEVEGEEFRAAVAWIPDTLPGFGTDETSGAWQRLPLAGVPFLLKDLYDVAGWPTAASSTFLSELRGIPADTSPLVTRLCSLGATPVGKTHLNEFAYGLSGRNAHFGHCRHPRFPDRMSGGSSSGSAWAVGRGLVPLALGSDTGGSVRVPASFCGLWGLRLTPDHDWSRESCFPLSPGLDTAGWFCGTPEDLLTVTRFLLEPSVTSGELRGVLLEPEGITFDPDLERAYDAFTRERDVTTEAGISDAFREATTDLVHAYNVIGSRAAFKVHEPWFDDRRDDYQPVVAERLERGRHWSREDIERADAGLEQLRGFFNYFFKTYDFAVLPAVPFPAPTLDRLDAGERTAILTLTGPASLGTLPVLTVPVFLENGLSGGLQYIYRDQSSDLPLRLLEGIIG